MTFQTFTGRQYLKIDIANNYGLDKLTWQERLDWFDKHQPQLDDLVGSAKEPALFYAGVKAYRDVEIGKPIGYMISLDATSSGLQLLAALTCDPFAAALCNVVDTGNREDAYQGIFQHMKQLVGSSVQLKPEDVKQAVMTAFYSSRAVPKKVFGEGPLLDVFYGTLQKLAPGAWELNEAMLSLWNPTALEHSWILPDNFHCHIKVMAPVREKMNFLGEVHDVFYNVNAPMTEGRSLGANTIHSIDGMIVRELTRRCDYDKRQIDHLQRLLLEGDFGTSQTTMNDAMVQLLWNRYQASGYLSARILDHLNEDNLGLVNTAKIQELLDSLPFRPFKVVSIHDCFRCLPHYGNDLRIQYNIQLQLIAQSTVLQDLISQLVGRPVIIGKLDPNLPARIQHTNYALS
jgi:hypothetical protein